MAAGSNALNGSGCLSRAGAHWPREWWRQSDSLPLSAKVVLTGGNLSQLFPAVSPWALFSGLHGCSKKGGGWRGTDNLGGLQGLFLDPLINLES